MPPSLLSSSLSVATLRGTGLRKIFGFTDRNMKGVEGVERAMNSALNPRRQMVRGRVTAGVGSFPKMRSRSPMRSLVGASTFTIDQRIQASLEEALIERVRDQQAEAGAGVVLDAKTGAVLAMASVPVLESGERVARMAPEFKERVAFYGYDLGSTVKPFVVAKALEARTIKAHQTFECDNGRILIPGKRRPTFDHHKMDKCTVTEIIAHSSNVGVVKIGRITGLNPMRSYFEEAGLTATPPLGIGRPRRGVAEASQWSPGEPYRRGGYVVRVCSAARCSRSRAPTPPLPTRGSVSTRIWSIGWSKTTSKRCCLVGSVSV